MDLRDYGSTWAQIRHRAHYNSCHQRSAIYITSLTPWTQDLTETHEILTPGTWNPWVCEYPMWEACYYALQDGVNPKGTMSNAISSCYPPWGRNLYQLLAHQHVGWSAECCWHFCQPSFPLWLWSALGSEKHVHFSRGLAPWGHQHTGWNAEQKPLEAWSHVLYPLSAYRCWHFQMQTDSSHWRQLLLVTNPKWKRCIYQGEIMTLSGDTIQRQPYCKIFYPEPKRLGRPPAQSR